MKMKPVKLRISGMPTTTVRNRAAIKVIIRVEEHGEFSTPAVWHGQDRCGIYENISYNGGNVLRSTFTDMDEALRWIADVKEDVQRRYAALCSELQKFHAWEEVVELAGHPGPRER